LRSYGTLQENSLSDINKAIVGKPRFMRGKDVTLQNISVKFGEFTAVHPTDLQINASEFFSILGPSGCGKTTLLRLISGFLEPSSGQVLIGNENMAGVGPHKRPTALIFQNLALFPLMPVWENVAFGLEMRGWAKNKRRERAYELLDVVALRDQAEKRPDELSGGQRQRVAVARALAVEPSVLLLDEPLSALDLKLRQHMRAELKQIQRKTGITFIYITHDQGEALTMSDRIAVMKDGVILQVDTTDRVYDDPATPFVASFVGENNIIRGEIIRSDGAYGVIATAYGSFRARNHRGLGVGAKAMLFVRPEKMQIVAGSKAPENRVGVSFLRRDLEGPFVNLFFHKDDQVFAVHLTNAGEAGREVRETLEIAFEPEDAMVMDAGELADE
jgi:spermidine/putrescine transport system ATP-binding protein